MWQEHKRGKKGSIGKMKIIEVSGYHINMECRDHNKNFVAYSEGHGMEVRGFFKM